MADAAAGGATKSSAKSAKSDAQKCVWFRAAPAVAALPAARCPCRRTCSCKLAQLFLRPHRDGQIALSARASRAARAPDASSCPHAGGGARPAARRAGPHVLRFPCPGLALSCSLRRVLRAKPRPVAKRKLRASLALPAAFRPSSARIRREYASKGGERCCVCGHAPTHASSCGGLPRTGAARSRARCLAVCLRSSRQTCPSCPFARAPSRTGFRRRYFKKKPDPEGGKLIEQGEEALKAGDFNKVLDLGFRIRA